jgi:hypothetical protein
MRGIEWALAFGRACCYFKRFNAFGPWPYPTFVDNEADSRISLLSKPQLTISLMAAKQDKAYQNI